MSDLRTILDNYRHGTASRDGVAGDSVMEQHPAHRVAMTEPSRGERSRGSPTGVERGDEAAKQPSHAAAGLVQALGLVGGQVALPGDRDQFQLKMGERAEGTGEVIEMAATVGASVARGNPHRHRPGGSPQPPAKPESLDHWQRSGHPAHILGQGDRLLPHDELAMAPWTTDGSHEPR